MTSKGYRWPRSPRCYGSRFRRPRPAPIAADCCFPNVCRCSWLALPVPSRNRPNRSACTGDATLTPVGGGASMVRGDLHPIAADAHTAPAASVVLAEVVEILNTRKTFALPDEGEVCMT